MSATQVPLGELMSSRGGGIDPAKFPEEVFDLYSIPAFDAGQPDVLAGVAIGSTKQIVEPGDVLVSKIVPHIRRSWVVQGARGRRQIASGEWIVFRGPRLHPPYLRQVLISDPFHRQFMNTTAGVGGSLIRARPSFVARIQIPLPPLSEQWRIAEVLDRADALRTKRREAMALLEDLSQSIFLEMFGDPAGNPRDLPVVELGEVLHSASDGPHVSPKYADGGVPFISTRHVRPGRVDWSDLKYLTQEDADIQWRKCRPRRGDILYTKGGSTGFAAAVTVDRAFAVWVHVAVLRPKTEAVDAIWLESMLNSAFCFAQSQSLTFGIANRDLGLRRMVRIKILLPPLAEQRAFSERMTDVVCLRRQGEMHLSHLQALGDSLRQRAFAGEL